MIEQITALDAPLLRAMHALYNRLFPHLRSDVGTFARRLRLNAGATALMERQNGALAGFAIAWGDALLLIAVEPSCQNRGIGSALLASAEALIGQSHRSVTLGHSGGTYLLAGVPMDDSADAHGFFARRGYAHHWTALDMVLDLKAYRRRPELDAKGDILIRPRSGDPAERAAARALGDEIGGFGPHYAQLPTVLLALRGGEIVGGVTVEPGACLFSESLPGAGAFGCLGVAERHRNQGIGMALCQDALEALKQSGATRCFIGYTWLDWWYGKLGARKYIDYWMGEKEIIGSNRC